MTPRPLDLMPLPTIGDLVRMSYKKMLAVWMVFALLLVALFVYTHHYYASQ
jgi:hypothetical protein